MLTNLFISNYIVGPWITILRYYSPIIDSVYIWDTKELLTTSSFDIRSWSCLYNILCLVSSLTLWRMYSCFTIFTLFGGGKMWKKCKLTFKINSSIYWGLITGTSVQKSPISFLNIKTFLQYRARTDTITCQYSRSYTRFVRPFPKIQSCLRSVFRLVVNY